MKNTPTEPSFFYKYDQEIMEQAGITNANFHTLRHSFATRCIENGMDIPRAAKTLMYSNAGTMLNKYSHLLPKPQKANMEKLEVISYWTGADTFLFRQKSTTKSFLDFFKSGEYF